MQRGCTGEALRCYGDTRLIAAVPPRQGRARPTSDRYRRGGVAARERCREGARRVDSPRTQVQRAGEGAIEVAHGETGLEPTIEIRDEDYPEIMRVIRSDGEVDTYLESAGIAPEVFGDDAGGGTTRCADERAALGGSLLYVVEVGEVTDASQSDGAITLPASAAASLMGSLTEVSNEGLRLADCLESTHPDAAARLRETFELLGLDDDRLRRSVEERSAGA